MGAVGFSSKLLKKKEREKPVFSIQYMDISKLYTHIYISTFIQHKYGGVYVSR